MDWMQFVSSLVASLAWPAASIGILVLFRNEVARLLPLLQKLTLPGGIEAVFDRDLATVKAFVEQSEAAQLVNPAPPEPEVANLHTPENNTTSLLGFMVPESDPIALRANPTGVVMEAWKALEAVLRASGNRAKAGVHVSNQVGFPNILHFLADANFLTSEEIDNLRKLKKMRDLAAHSQDPISAESANDFAEIAGRLTRNLAVRMGQMYPVVQ